MENYCNYCGGLSWTVLKYGRKIHKQNCPDRIEEFHQGNPPPIPELAILSKLEEERPLFFTEKLCDMHQRPACDPNERVDCKCEWVAFERQKVVAPSEEVKQERKKIELGEIFEVDGKCYMFRNPDTASEKPNTDHGHILHEISFLE